MTMQEPNQAIRPTGVPGQPGTDQLFQQVWDKIEKTIDDRITDLRHPTQPRVFGINVPFGVEGTPIVVPSTIPVGETVPRLYLMSLGIDFPCRITGWRLWCKPAATLQMDIRKTTHTTSEHTIVPVSAAVSTPAVTYASSDDVDVAHGWAAVDLVCWLDDALSFYVLANDTAEIGLLRLRLRDLTLDR